MIKYLLGAFLIALASADNPPIGGSLEDLIHDIFTPPPDLSKGNNNGYQPGVIGQPGGIGQPGIGQPGDPGHIPPQQPPIEANPCPEGECVPYYQCSNGQVITDGEGLLDIRFGEENNINKEAHPCKGLFETCCTLKSETPMIPEVPCNHGCGIRNVDGVGFRIKGDKDSESQFGEFPWTVAILKEEQSLDKVLNVYQCGGSLISTGVVLTAAHCVSEKVPSSLKVRAGEWDTQTKDEIFPHQDRYVSEIIIHEEYYKGGLFNDIALLFLDKPVEIAENVNTVCLPPQDHIFDGSRCFASGWGKDLFGKSGKYQVILKRVELPIVPREPCVHALRNTRLGQHFELNKSFICAGGERGKDTCKGDGGSPLVCPVHGETNRYFQAGIVAWGIGCGDETPGVYVNVALFRNWIDSKMLHKRFDQSSYIL
ncbi:hypothetical protein HA402_004957 [Bradysia odoriphaga]|nr:hypothetical protein HA402_004957 [Bradysia odoriphaga]